MYINIATNEYPISFGTLKKRHGTTAFSKEPDAFGDYRKVYDGVIPSYTAEQYVEEGTPVLDGDTYKRNWVVHNYTAEQIAQRTGNADATAAASVRRQRDTLIAETDYLALSDTTLTTEMAAYRQALRDITDHASFPYLADTDWPVKP